ncbi:transposase [Streptomyces albogriseolus]|uniref:transposase n=1 Tax=Streptomyces albogriseolus TaxID=1887 RepID=UPI0037B07676
MLPESLLGRQRLDDRTVLNGTVGKFRTGTARRDVPERYGPWATPQTWFRRRVLGGTCERMLRAARTRADTAGDVDWPVPADSTVVRARQHDAGARDKGSAPPRSDAPEVASSAASMRAMPRGVRSLLTCRPPQRPRTWSRIRHRRSAGEPPRPGRTPASNRRRGVRLQS